MILMRLELRSQKSETLNVSTYTMISINSALILHAHYILSNVAAVEAIIKYKKNGYYKAE
jgi:hypothetical protein